MNSTYRNHRLLQARARDLGECRSLLRTAQADLDQKILGAIRDTRRAHTEWMRWERKTHFILLVVLAMSGLIFMVVLAEDIRSHMLSP